MNALICKRRGIAILRKTLEVKNRRMTIPFLLSRSQLLTSKFQLLTTNYFPPYSITNVLRSAAMAELAGVDLRVQ